MSYDSMLNELRNQLKSLSSGSLEELRAMKDNMQRERDAFNREREGRQRERAEKARAGDLGPDMQRLQSRVDRGETTWAKVFSGEDDHPSAEVARRNIQRNLETMAEQVRNDPEVAEVDAETRERAEEVGGDEPW